MLKRKTNLRKNFEGVKKMNRIKNALSIPANLLDGKKSYIGFVITFLAGGLYFTGNLDQETAQVIASIGGLVAAVGIRHAMEKIIKGI